MNDYTRNNGILGAVIMKDAGGRRETGNQFGVALWGSLAIRFCSVKIVYNETIMYVL